MIKLLKKKNNDIQINNYFYSRFLKKNTKFSVLKKLDILIHYKWWFINKRDFYFYKIKNKQFIYFWSEVNFFKKKKYCTIGFHADNEINIMEIFKTYKIFLKHLKKKYKIPILGITEKKNLFMIKVNKDLGFKIILDKQSSEYIFLKKKFMINKNLGNYIYFFMKN